MSRVVLDVGLPLMLLDTISTASLGVHAPWRLLVSFYLPVLLLYLTVALVSRYAFREPPATSVICGFGSAFGNLALLGMPVALRVFGPQGMVPFFIVFSLHSLVLITLTVMLLEGLRNQGPPLARVPVRAFSVVARTPLLVALIAALVMNRLDASLPPPVAAIAGGIGEVVPPAALFLLGASLAACRFAGERRRALSITLCKLVLLPLLVWVTAQGIFGLGRLQTMVLILMASQPGGVMIPLVAERYGIERDLATTTVFLSTAFSILTNIMLIGVIHQVGIPVDPR